jgi:hypothetical protein
MHRKAIYVITLTLLIAASLVVVFSSGILFPVSPAQRLITSVTSSINSNYGVTYAITIPALGDLSSLIGANLTFSIYHLNNYTKGVLEIPNIVAYGVYYDNNTNYVIACSQLSSIYSYLSQGLTCSATSINKTSEVDILKLKTIIYKALNTTLNKSIVYEGMSSVTNRPCSAYEISLNASQITNITQSILSAFNSTQYTATPYSLSTTPSPGLIYKAAICIDDGIGYVSSLNITMLNYSQILNKNTTSTLIKMKAINVTTTLQASEFKVPVDFVGLKILCTNTTVNMSFLSTVDTANTTVIIRNLTYEPASGTTASGAYYPNNNYESLQLSTGTSGLKAYNVYNVSGHPLKALSQGFQEPTLCVNGDCQSETLGAGCLVPYSFGGNNTNSSSVTTISSGTGGIASNTTGSG